MRAPRRGGPYGRGKAWINICRQNPELRKLIPAYFPSNTVTTVTISSENSQNENNISSNKVNTIYFANPVLERLRNRGSKY